MLELRSKKPETKIKNPSDQYVDKLICYLNVIYVL